MPTKTAINTTAVRVEMIMAAPDDHGVADVSASKVSTSVRKRTQDRLFARMVWGAAARGLRLVVRQRGRLAHPPGPRRRACSVSVGPVKAPRTLWTRWGGDDDRLLPVESGPYSISPRNP
jgi:hypothetical protein